MAHAAETARIAVGGLSAAAAMVMVAVMAETAPAAMTPAPSAEIQHPPRQILIIRRIHLRSGPAVPAPPATAPAPTAPEPVATSAAS